MSHSVPLAIILLQNIQVAGSKSNKAISEFILLIADLFDIIESRSNFGKYTKRPFDLENSMILKST